MTLKLTLTTLALVLVPALSFAGRGGGRIGSGSDGLALAPPSAQGATAFKGISSATRSQNMSVWEILERAIKNGTAEKKTVTIASNGGCGEIDPYYIQDACIYEAHLDQNQSKKVMIVFDEDQGGLVIGAKVDALLVEYDHDSFVARIQFEHPLQANGFYQTGTDMSVVLQAYTDFCLPQSPYTSVEAIELKRDNHSVDDKIAADELSRQAKAKILQYLAARGASIQNIKFAEQKIAVRDPNQTQKGLKICARQEQYLSHESTKMILATGTSADGKKVEVRAFASKYGASPNVYLATVLAQ